MGSVHLVKDHFSAVERLADILAKRMITVVSDNAGTDQNVGNSAGQSGGQTGARIDSFICSAAYEKTLGGQDALLAKGRSMRATQMIVVAEDQESFSCSEEFGGKFVRLGLPKIKANTAASDDFGLQLIATLLSVDSNVAAGDPLTLDLLALGRRVANTDVTVFVNGPTGTGKEVLAKFIHNNSQRATAPFVAINCAAIPENMLEAILFGHEKGSFTGASTANKGIFRAADGGTLLLDEISEMPMSLQAKLLRALQEKAVTPIGSHTDIPVNVRVIATTNRNMTEEIRNGAFREDLYYRLNVFPLATASVAARPADIVPIAAFLLRRHCPNLADVPWLDDSAVAALQRYSWPGNVRELENVLQRALVLAMDGVITAGEIVTDETLSQLTSPQMGGLGGTAPSLHQQVAHG